MMNTIEEEEEDYHMLLPDVITTEILCRLPAELIMQCKLVCKIWRALIVDPIFINMYTRRHYTPTAAETEWVVFPVISHIQFVKYYNNDDSDENQIKQSKPIIYHPSSLEVMGFKKIGSCNGLIFMTTLANRMFVCNPFTREYVDLPRIKFNNLGFGMRMATGFGYHSSTNEYKVIIIYYFSDSKGDSKGQVTIYTLGSGEWRDKGEISHRLIDGVKAGGVLFKGALHWLTKKMDDIVSFDLADEEFRIVPSPSPPPPPSPSPSQLRSSPLLSSSQLGLLGGCLYVTRKRRSIEDHPAQTSTDIWVTDSREYSWSKKFNISWKSRLSNHRPLALLQSGRILLRRSGEHLISFDPETESSIIVDGSFSKLISRLYTYTKTIVSLKALGETDAMILDPFVCEPSCSDLIENRIREAAESTEMENKKRARRAV